VKDPTPKKKEEKSELETMVDAINNDDSDDKEI